MKFTYVSNFKPLQTLMKVVTFAFGIGILAAADVSLPVALPWALFVTAVVTFTFDE